MYEMFHQLAQLKLPDAKKVEMMNSVESYCIPLLQTCHTQMGYSHGLLVHYGDNNQIFGIEKISNNALTKLKKTNNSLKIRKYLLLEDMSIIISLCTSHTYIIPLLGYLHLNCFMKNVGEGVLLSLHTMMKLFSLVFQSNV